MYQSIYFGVENYTICSVNAESRRKCDNFLSLFAMQKKNQKGHTQCENVDARFTSQQFVFFCVIQCGNYLENSKFQ